MPQRKEKEVVRYGQATVNEFQLEGKEAVKEKSNS